MIGEIETRRPRRIPNGLVYTMFLVAGIAFLIAVGGVALTLVSNSHRVQEINVSRFDNTVSACETKQDDAAKQRAFWTAKGIATEAEAARTWTAPANCEIYALNRVKP